MDAGIFDLRWETALKAPGWLGSVSEVLACGFSADFIFNPDLLLMAHSNAPQHSELQTAPSRPGF